MKTKDRYTWELAQLSKNSNAKLVKSRRQALIEEAKKDGFIWKESVGFIEMLHKPDNNGDASATVPVMPQAMPQAITAESTAMAETAEPAIIAKTDEDQKEISLIDPVSGESTELAIITGDNKAEQIVAQKQEKALQASSSPEAVSEESAFIKVSRQTPINNQPSAQKSIKVKTGAPKQSGEKKMPNRYGGVARY